MTHSQFFGTQLPESTLRDLDVVVEQARQDGRVYGSELDTKVGLRFGDPGMYGPSFRFSMPGWEFAKRFQQYKSLRDAETGAVLEHAFLVETSKGHEYAGELPGSTFEIWIIEPNNLGKPRVIRHAFNDVDCLNNWDFAVRYFIRLFGCGTLTDDLEVPERLFETSVFGPSTDL